ncbi:MAG: hypothetical protein B7X79_19275 [Acidovorax sp. 17-64-282]|nr:MAG: hypothetical protein B7X79_19275 [Acidovorax sp. 17-64-282]
MHWIALPLPWCDEPAATPGAAEHAAAAGWWALRFTPRVALVDGDTVLLEVSTTERLWGGRDALLAQVLQAWADASVGLPDHPATREAGVPPPGTQAVWGCGQTALVAQAWLRMAQAGRTPSRHNVEGLPLHTLTALRPHVAMSENLARTALAAPVNQITLRLLESAPLPHRSASLLPPGDRVGGGRDDLGGAPGEALHQLLERLSARLGADHVVAPVLQADHRPERMQQWCPAAEVLGHGCAPPGIQTPDTKAPDATLWPTWLLRPPRRLAVQGNRPCHHGVLRLLAGPHRFEAGWWSAADEGAGDPAHPCAGLALRDYFVAHNDVAGLVWVFRERLAPQPGGAVQKDATQKGAMTAAQPHRWFLHGIFG